MYLLMDPFDAIEEGYIRSRAIGLDEIEEGYIAGKEAARLRATGTGET